MVKFGFDFIQFDHDQEDPDIEDQHNHTCRNSQKTIVGSFSNLDTSTTIINIVDLHKLLIQFPKDTYTSNPKTQLKRPHHRNILLDSQGVIHTSGCTVQFLIYLFISKY